MSAEPHLARLARGGALNLVGAASAGIMGLALVFAVAHGYAQHVAGAFFAATSLFVILNAVSGLGSDAGLLRWLPRHLAFGDHAAARRTVPIALVAVVAVACLAALVLGFTAPWLSARIGDPQVTPMLRVLAVFLPIAATHDAILAATRGHATMRPTVVIEKVFRQTAQVAGVLIASQLTDGPVALALAWALPYPAGLVVAIAWYRRIVGRLDHRGAAPTRALAGEFWRYTAPRAIAQVCQSVLQRADIVLIAALASPREAAIYTAATRFMVIGQLGTQAVQQAMQPAVSRLLALEDREGTARIFAGCTTWTVTLTWPVHLAVAVAAPIYLSAFGPGYTGAGEYATVILAMAMLLATGSGPVDVMLLMAGRSALSLANNAAALTVDLALNVALIPRLGLTGAATAWAAALVVGNVLPLVQVRRLLGMSPAGLGLGLAATSTVACFGVLPLIAGLSMGTMATLAGVAVGALAYAGLLWAGRTRLALTAFAALLPGRRSVAPNQGVVHGL
ncbi:MAG: polysaccharide biosynthesis protein [Actinoallomurus sp.]|nr:polysaccharide biosynthesis protein [Actinoallomurus sp.]